MAARTYAFVADTDSLEALRDSPFTAQENEVAVFRDEAVAACEFTDAVAITTEGAALVVRLALRPGWLEVVDDPEQIAEFFRLRGDA